MLTIEYFSLTKYIAGIYRESKNSINTQLQVLNIRATESDLLLVVYDHPAQTQKDLAASLMLDPSLLARTVRQLEQRQLVIRFRDPADQRSLRISLTPAGEQIAIAIKKTLIDWWHDFFAAHPEVNEQVFTNQLQQVYLALQEKRD
ncbi:MarR family winged helix-turn-helix transcriptional regulator [Lactiplantibacillus plantarum]|uniref:MarR family winged helix-turn-helix transcriptional regulator n=1 Tax=Lactiplantibacillus plantarum TaxID=1590 RepID=UPI0013DDAE00|nr:MarR family transcriptional regulator [Lactiplantibacillus plantarum]WFP18104.1 MarR family transcriptional regulator [Lactiplantibacillus plantarum]